MTIQTNIVFQHMVLAMSHLGFNNDTHKDRDLRTVQSYPDYLSFAQLYIV